MLTTHRAQAEWEAAQLDRAHDAQRLADLAAQCCMLEAQLADSRQESSTAKVSTTRASSSYFLQHNVRRSFSDGYQACS